MRFYFPLCAVFVAIAQLQESSATESRQIGSVRLKATDLLQFSTQDYLSNWIETKLGMTAGQFLVVISNTVGQVHGEINAGISALQNFMGQSQLDLKTRERIRNLINNALTEALGGMTPIQNDLGQVIPLISSTFAHRSNVGDTIYAILKVTFEAFLRTIAGSLEQSFYVISGASTELNSIANSLPSPLQSQLRAISNTYLLRSLDLIRPVLSNLHEVLSESKNTILSDVVSRSLNFDVVNASMNLDLALHNITGVLEEFVLEANTMLVGYPRVKESLNKILTVSVTEAEDLIDPILAVLFQFNGGQHFDKGYSNDIVSTIFGLSLQDFLTYMDHVGQRLPLMYNRTEQDIRDELEKVTPPVRNPILRLMTEMSEKVAASLDPFLCAISPILGQRVWVPLEDFLEEKAASNKSEHRFCDFSLRSGHNVELLEHLISDAFGFNVTEAAQVLVDVLSDLETLYSKASQEITVKVSSLRPSLAAEVTNTLNASLTNSTKMILPAIDVLGEFLHIPGRLDRDVVLGMVRSVQHLHLDSFMEYLTVGTERAADVASRTFRRIHDLLTEAEIGLDSKSYESDENSLVEEIDEIMTHTLEETQKIAKPFYDIISPQDSSKTLS